MPTITLKVREKGYELPSYSLTGDILGYLRCGLQYRYTRLGKMPPRSPVQLWFGHFIHGCMDEGFRRYKAAREKKLSHVQAMQEVDPDIIIPFIEERLLNQGVAAWEPWLKLLGYARARVALLELGPHLFPLISQSEVRLTGSRDLKPLPPPKVFRRADHYEMVGVIDVVTDVEMATHSGNQIVELVKAKLGALPERFELIVDYKGSRRPPNLKSISGQNPSLWDQYEWQVLTYAELRAKQIGSKPVAAGIVIYVNELLPLEGDLFDLEREISGFTQKNGTKLSTDQPVDPSLIKPWRGAAKVAADNAEKEQESLMKAGDKTADLKASKKLTTAVPWDVRLRRAMRMVKNESASRIVSLQAFDGTVYKIECCRGDEFHGKQIVNAWDTNATDRSTCAACDSRTWCPSFSKQHAGGKPVSPEPPKVKVAGA
jgi:hypothetical protein